MDQKPFKFEESNPRLVANVYPSQTTPWVAGAIFLGAIQLYRRRVYRFDNNFGKFAIYAVVAPWASW